MPFFVYDGGKHIRRVNSFFFGNCRVGSLHDVGVKKGIPIFARLLVVLLKVGSINALGLYA